LKAKPITSGVIPNTPLADSVEPATLVIRLFIIIIKLALWRIHMISADLGARLEDFVSKLVESGRYGSKSEVLRDLPA